MIVLSFVASLALALIQSPDGKIAAAAPAAPAGQASGYVPQRVYDTRRQAFSDFEVMLADLAAADVVFVGEQHDDANTHRLEAAILEGLKRRQAAPVVSLEMFERDVQGTLDAYLAGTIGEADLLKTSRPWPRYRTDYAPLVEIARSSGWRVVAANVPRRIASAVAKEGRDAIAQLPPEERGLVARELECPADAYFERFATSMASHPAPNQTADEQRLMTKRYYWSQCVKDETMAESIAMAVEGREARAPLVHYNGAFHSDFGLGTAARTRRRLPGRRVVVVSVLPVASLDSLSPSGEDLERADYLVYTVK